MEGAASRYENFSDIYKNDVVDRATANNICFYFSTTERAWWERGVSA